VKILAALILCTSATLAATPQGGGLFASSRKARPGLLSGVWRFIAARSLDLLDVAEINLAVGPGLKAGIEYGAARTTLGLVQAERFGFDGRQVGAWVEKNASFGILPASLLFAPCELFRRAGEPWRSLAVYGFEMGSLGAERTERQDFATTAVLYRQARMAGPWHERPGDMASFGLELHLLLVGGRARFKPLEALDFLAGFVGVDLDPALAHPEEEAVWGNRGFRIIRSDHQRSP